MSRLVLQTAVMLMPSSMVILVGVGLRGDLHGPARLGQPDLDPLPADHDGAADRDPSFDGERIGQSWWFGVPGPGSAQPVPGRLPSGQATLLAVERAGPGADRAQRARTRLRRLPS